MTLDEQAKKTLSIGLFIAIVIFAGFAYWHVTILKLHYSRNEKKKDELKVEIKKYNLALSEIRNAELQKDRIEEMRKIVAEAARRLPNSPDAIGFYHELIRILRITGVGAKRVDPLPNKAQAMYTEIPYSIKSVCRYHELGQFLNLLEENQSRFMRVKSFSINNNDSRPSMHPVSVDIATFMFTRVPGK
jgi:Tfp pilus assembly protein PilO